MGSNQIAEEDSFDCIINITDVGRIGIEKNERAFPLHQMYQIFA